MSTIVKDNNKKYLAIAFKHLLTALLIAIIGSWCFQLLYPAIAGIFTNTAKNETEKYKKVLENIHCS